MVPREERVRHFGVDLILEPGVFSNNVREAIKNKQYESGEAKQLKQILQYRERVLEVGGGIGFMSTVAAKDENCEAVEVYEANPDLNRIIERVHAENQVTGVKVVQGVLANGPPLSPVNFYLRNDFWASSLSPGPYGYRDVVEVPQYSFSATVERFQPTVIVADIEGGELDLLRHANLNGVEKVLVEVHQRVLGRQGMKQLFDAMSARDFHYDQFHSSGGVILFSHVKRDEMRRARERKDSEEASSTG